MCSCVNHHETGGKILVPSCQLRVVPFGYKPQTRTGRRIPQMTRLRQSVFRGCRRQPSPYARISGGTYAAAVVTPLSTCRPRGRCRPPTGASFHPIVRDVFVIIGSRIPFLTSSPGVSHSGLTMAHAPGCVSSVPRGLLPTEA